MCRAADKRMTVMFPSSLDGSTWQVASLSVKTHKYIDTGCLFVAITATATPLHAPCTLIILCCEKNKYSQWPARSCFAKCKSRKSLFFHFLFSYLHKNEGSVCQVRVQRLHLPKVDQRKRVSGQKEHPEIC